MEIRAKGNLRKSREYLKSRAEFLGDYEFTDHVRLTDTGYKRKRCMVKSNHGESGCIMIEKKDGVKALLISDFEPMFSFHRIGEEWLYKGCHVYLEDVEYIGETVELIGDDVMPLHDELGLGEILKQSLAHEIYNQ